MIGFLAGFAHVYSVQAGFDWVPPAELSSAPSDNYRNSDVLPFPDDASSVPVLKSAPEDQKGYESHPVSAPQIEWGPSDQQDAVSAAPSIKNGGSETRAVPVPIRPLWRSRPLLLLGQRRLIRLLLLLGCLVGHHPLDHLMYGWTKGKRLRKRQ